MLTFDDGYKDHVIMFLELLKKKFQDFYQLAVQSWKKILDINLIHAIQSQSIPKRIYLMI